MSVYYCWPLYLYHYYCIPREYLALFKKTVAMHEVFLQRLAAHPIFRDDYNFQTFLEYEGEVCKFCSRLHLMSPFLEAHHSFQEHSWEVWLHVQGFVKDGGRGYHLEEPQRRGPVVWGREEILDRLSHTVSPSSSPYYVSFKIIVLRVSSACFSSVRVKDCTKQSDRTTKVHKRLADSFIGVASYISLLPITKDDPLSG